MNDNERIEMTDHVHMLVAIRRKKENRESKEICFREVIRDYEVSLAAVKGRISQFPGVWRIYRTINKRNVDVARKMVMKKLIDCPDEFSHKIDSLWKTCLMKPECKGERNVLLDIDTKMKESDVYDIIRDNGLNWSGMKKTPNGWHVVANKPNTKDLSDKYPGITCVRDGYIFMELVEVKEGDQ